MKVIIGLVYFRVKSYVEIEDDSKNIHISFGFKHRRKKLNEFV